MTAGIHWLYIVLLNCIAPEIQFRNSFTSESLQVNVPMYTCCIFSEHLFVSTALVVCLRVEWFLWARFLLECMSILFHLTGLTLFSASACFILIYFHKILMLWNTIICSSDCFAKSSILLCSHGAYCLNRVCTQKTFNLSRLAASAIIFVTLFRMGFLKPLFGCVC